MIRCALCNHKFDPEKEFHFLCYDCAEENYLVGSTELNKCLRAISTLINSKLNMEEMKLIADSKSFCEFAREVISVKDIDTRIKYLAQLIKEAQA